MCQYLLPIVIVVISLLVHTSHFIKVNMFNQLFNVQAVATVALYQNILCLLCNGQVRSKIINQTTGMLWNVFDHVFSGKLDSKCYQTVNGGVNRNTCAQIQWLYKQYLQNTSSKPTFTIIKDPIKTSLIALQFTKPLFFILHYLTGYDVWCSRSANKC